MGYLPVFLLTLLIQKFIVEKSAHHGQFEILFSQAFFDLTRSFVSLQAKSMFEKLYPEEPFFPRVPDPEEIIFAGGDDEETNSENNSEVKEEEKPISTDETHEDDIKSVESI